MDSRGKNARRLSGIPANVVAGQLAAENPRGFPSGNSRKSPKCSIGCGPALYPDRIVPTNSSTVSGSGMAPLGVTLLW